MYLPLLFVGALPGKPASASRMSDVAPWPLEKVEECDDSLFPMLLPLPCWCQTSVYFAHTAAATAPAAAAIVLTSPSREVEVVFLAPVLSVARSFTLCLLLDLLHNYKNPTPMELRVHLLGCDCARSSGNEMIVALDTDTLLLPVLLFTATAVLLYSTSSRVQTQT